MGTDIHTYYEYPTPRYVDTEMRRRERAGQVDRLHAWQELKQPVWLTKQESAKDLMDPVSIEVGWCGYKKVVDWLPFWQEHRNYDLFAWLSGVRTVDSEGIMTWGLPEETSADPDAWEVGQFLHHVGHIRFDRLINIPIHQYQGVIDLQNMAAAIVARHPDARIIVGYDC